MTVYTEKIEIYQADGTTLRQSWEVTDRGLAPTHDIPWQDTLTFEQLLPGGFGAASFTIYKDEETITAQIHDVVVIYWEGVKRYEGRITNLQKALNESNPNSDATRFTCDNMLNVDAGRLIYDLNDSNDTKVSTDIDTILTDLFYNDQYTDKGQGFNVGILANTNISFTATPGNLPVLSVNAYYKKASIINVLHELVAKANGTLDLSLVEPYIMYIDGYNVFNVKQRATLPVKATLSLDTGQFRVKHSDDFDDYSDTLDTNIINQIIINGVDYTSNTSKYWTQIEASRTAYGIRQKNLDRDDLYDERLQEWVDGKILNLLEPMNMYRFKLKKEKYGFAQIWFNGGSDDPEGYIQIDNATEAINEPFKKCTYRSTASGYEQVIEIGKYRPNLDLSSLAVYKPITNTTPSLYVSFLDNTVTADHAPATFECSSPDGFRVRIDADAQDLVSIPIVTYGGVSVTLTYDTTEGAYLVSLARPTIGSSKVIKVTAENNYGKKLKSYHYVKGVELSKSGVDVAVIDDDAAASASTTSAPEYTDNITLKASFKDSFAVVNLADVSIKLYRPNGTLVKTFTSVSTPAIIESPADSGVFTVSTTEGFGLGYALYDAEATIIKREDFIDEAGVTHNHTQTITGRKTRYRYILKTTTDTTDDHEIRLPTAEQESNVDYNDGTDNVRSKIKFFPAGTAPDASGAGWFGTKDNRFSTNWIRLAVDQTGTPELDFIINSGAAAGQYIQITFNSDATGTPLNKGALRYDQVNKKFETSVDGQVTWVDLSTGVGTAIANTVAGTTYTLKIDATTGALIYEDTTGVSTLWSISTAGDLTIYGDVLPDVDDGATSLGSETLRWSNIFCANTVYTYDVVFTPDGTDASANGKLETIAGIVYAEGIAFGFQEG